MKLLGWIGRRFASPPPPVTPPEEHEELRRRLREVECEAGRLERLAQDYKDLDRGLRDR